MKKIGILLLGAVLVGLACTSITGRGAPEPTAVPTRLPALPVQAGETNPDEPVFVSGTIPFTNRFFLNTLAEPFVLLEDQAGFVARDRDFAFSRVGQAIGPVDTTDDENTLRFSLALPSIPQGSYVDVDNDADADVGVQVFAVAYWSNTWGDPFLERRDGHGWSTAHASTVTDPEKDDEIVGGYLIIWAPDEAQAFPSGFGDDGSLFTPDDPTVAVPAGYSIVNLDTNPFTIYKEAQPELVLVEGASQVKDFSDLSYEAAFAAMFERVSREYPFTEDKNIDWEALEAAFGPRVAAANGAQDFYRAIRDFTLAIPDRHVGLTLDSQVFFEERGGSFGLVLAELSDGRVLVTDVLSDTPGARAGIRAGAEVLAWDNQPVGAAIDAVISDFGPYSTAHHERLDKLVFLTRVPPDTQIEIEYRNPGDENSTATTLRADIEYDSLFLAVPAFSRDELSLPITSEILAGHGLGYIRIDTFSDDFNLMARLWERALQALVDQEVPGVILDLRFNNGGSGGLAMDFAGYFFAEEVETEVWLYYNDLTGQFEPRDRPSSVEPGPFLYEGAVALLVGPHCISACESFAYALTQKAGTIVVGHFPTSGTLAEVGQGQYKLPEDLSLQFPTGRPETLDGQLLIEGVGVVPDIVVPVTAESVLGIRDAVLEAAVEALK